MSDPDDELEPKSEPSEGGPWAKTSSGDAEATTTGATGGVAGGDPELDGDED